MCTNPKPGTLVILLHFVHLFSLMNVIVQCDHLHIWQQNTLTLNRKQNSKRNKPFAELQHPTLPERWLCLFQGLWHQNPEPFQRVRLRILITVVSVRPAGRLCGCGRRILSGSSHKLLWFSHVLTCPDPSPHTCGIQRISVWTIPPQGGGRGGAHGKDVVTCMADSPSSFGPMSSTDVVFWTRSVGLWIVILSVQNSSASFSTALYQQNDKVNLW